MKSFLQHILILCIPFASCEYGWWMGSKVIELSNENFFEFVGKEKNVVVEFYAKWCGYCKIMAPEYEILFQKYHGSNAPRKDIIIARIDGKDNSEISDIYNVFAFPSIYIFKKGEIQPSPKYQGIRKAEIFSMWIEDKLGPELISSLNETKEVDLKVETKEIEKLVEKHKENLKEMKEEENNNPQENINNKDKLEAIQIANTKSEQLLKNKKQEIENIELEEENEEESDENSKPWMRSGKRPQNNEEYTEIPDTYQKLLEDLEKVKESIQVQIEFSLMEQGVRVFILSLFGGLIAGLIIFKRMFERNSQEHTFFKSA